MGLPIWRDPDEITIKKERESTVKPDPTAAARSPIRRRSSPHVARRRSSYYPSRQPLPPALERSERYDSALYAEGRAAGAAAAARARGEAAVSDSNGFSGVRGETRGVPPVSTLLESARWSAPRAPSSPPGESPFPRPRGGVRFRHRPDSASAIALERRSLIDTGRRGMDDEVRRIQSEIVPGDWEDWNEEDREQWLEENNIPRYLHPSSGETGITDGFVSANRPDSRDGPRRSALPTPPHDESQDGDSLFIPADQPTTLRRTSSIRRRHPLSRSWRPESPVNGLGDRNRSPTPADTWEVMRQTIAPDATLPSADSSFTSAAASLSFNSNNSASTSLTDPDYPTSSNHSRRNSQEDDDSVSSVDPDNLVCDDEVEDEEIAATTAFAEHVYRHEQSSHEGRQRIARHADDLEVDAHRYAHRNDQRTVEIGFRLIDEALNTPEGRVRVFALSESLPDEIRQNLSSWINRDTRASSSRTRLTHIEDTSEPRDGIARTEAQNAVRRQVHGFFRRFTADETLSASQRETLRLSERNSPPPLYSPLPVIEPEISISHDEPLAHPVAFPSPSRAVSPPSARSERDITEALLSGDEQDLSAVRRIVERLAQRDDVPQEWWMSMGLNLSRTRARSRSRSRSPERDGHVDAVRRVRSGRVERERGTGSRL